METREQLERRVAELEKQIATLKSGGLVRVRGVRKRAWWQVALVTLPAAALLMFSASLTPEDSGPLVEVKVTQQYLEPLCLNGAPVKPGKRRWRLAPQAQSLAFTMRNEPHQGASKPKVTPGVAVIWFTPETGHKYEVEIRASASTFASRIWDRGQWRPVVRDRTTDRIVSSEPEWRDSGCHA